RFLFPSFDCVFQIAEQHAGCLIEFAAQFSSDHDRHIANSRSYDIRRQKPCNGIKRKEQQMKRTIASLLLVLIQLSGQSRAQSTGDVARQLAGMWRLVSNPTRLADGTTRQGSNIGYAFFDATGSHMCFLTMNPDRPAWKSEIAPTPEEGLTALKGINAYCATLEIHA